MGDVAAFEFPDVECTHVLHMATEAGPTMSPITSFRTAVAGTGRVLSFAANRGVRKLLLTSSGAMYGMQPPDIDRLQEDYAGAPRTDDPAAGYGHGKRAAEYLCSVAASQTALEVKIARCFAFVGPTMPVDANFAIGNFIRDALERDQIEVKGDGSRAPLVSLRRRPRRVALDHPDEGPVRPALQRRLGSRCEHRRPRSHGGARSCGRDAAVQIAQTPVPGSQPARYVPSTARAREELGVRERIALDDGIKRTAGWYAAGPSG